MSRGIYIRNREKYPCISKTEEHRKKIGLANSIALKENKNGSAKRTEEYKKNKSLVMMGNTNAFKGNKHYRWIDGRSKNPKYINWIKNKRNRDKRNAKGSHTFGEWEILKKQYGYVCPCCGNAEPEIQLTEDHIIPLSKGGSDYIDNIQPLCKSCNCKKYTKIIKYE